MWTSPAPLFPERASRIHGLDFLRGLCIVLMVFDHIMFDFMWFYYGVDHPLLAFLQRDAEIWWDSTFRLASRLTVICIFFAISGISSSFSHNNFLRGIKLAVASVVLSLVTLLGDALFDLDIAIYFGVLHCFTVSILIFALLQFLLKDKAKYACLGLGVLLFVWGLLIDFYNAPLLYSYSGHEVDFTDMLKLMIGTRSYGADWFGILPHTGIFLIGCYGGAELYKRRAPFLPLFSRRPFRPLCFVGRKAVWFYLLHQVVVFLLIILLAAVCGVRVL